MGSDVRGKAEFGKVQCGDGKMQRGKAQPRGAARTLGVVMSKGHWLHSHLAGVPLPFSQPKHDCVSPIGGLSENLHIYNEIAP